MKILITGGAGFVGHHFVEHILKNTDHEIVSVGRNSICLRIDEKDAWFPFEPMTGGVCRIVDIVDPAKTAPGPSNNSIRMVS